jgi:hypothetical protein
MIGQQSRGHDGFTYVEAGTADGSSGLSRVGDELPDRPRRASQQRADRMFRA